jgi:hypothetical protein
MTRSIMPAFARYPEEAQIICHLLAGYGEIEYELAMCVAAIIGNVEIAIRTMFRMRAEGQRLEVADALVRYKYEEAGLGPQYKDGFDAAVHCKKIRNQFAHCHWTDHPERGLEFVNLAEAAKRRSGQSRVTIHRINLPLLREQEAYFCYTSDCLSFVHKEYLRLDGRLKEHPFSMPPKRQQPSLHTPPETPPNPTPSTDLATQQ